MPLNIYIHLFLEILYKFFIFGNVRFVYWKWTQQNQKKMSEILSKFPDGILNVLLLNSLSELLQVFDYSVYMVYINMWVC